MKVRELSDKYKISASFPQAEHTQLISWQMGDVVLDRLNERYLVYTKDISKDQDIFCIPIYMVPYL